MKNHILALFSLMVCVASSAQHPLISAPQQAVESRTPRPHVKAVLTGFEEGPSMILPLEVSIGDAPLLLSSSDFGSSQVIGRTYYDLQSNAAIDDRALQVGNEQLAAWTMSRELSPFADRGTGFNEYNGNEWGALPTTRLESVRTGWPSMNQLGDGREVVISHAGIDTPLHMVRRDAGTGTWEDSDLPNYAELEDGTLVGNLWPRAAVGGLNDEIIHVICISTPIANGGAEYQGQDGCLLYYRSLDSGDTWEMSTFPELDTTHFINMSADAYAIHAEGGKVAFAVFNDLQDSFVMISDDAGDTWEYHTLVDFPVDLYTIDSGLPDNLGYDFDGDGIFAEYLNSDGAGDVHIDVDGTVHCVFGAMYYADTDTVDGNYSYFPGTNGLQYWREDFGADSSVTIAYAYDIDESGTLDLEDEIAAYFVNLAGIPSMGSDDDGNLYVSYSAIMENYSSGTQNYRHVYVVNSQDSGDSWNTTAACDLTPDLEFEGYENVFASLAPRMTDTLQVIFQRDFEPGLHVRGDQDPVDLNDIVAMRLSMDALNQCAFTLGCTNPDACNYSVNADVDDGSCEFDSCFGCMDEVACNYNPTAVIPGFCDYSCLGCTDPSAQNWDPSSTVDDGSCQYFEPSCLFIGDEGWESLEPGLYTDSSSHYVGTDVTGDWVLNLPSVITEPASGSMYAVLSWADLSIGNLPPGLAYFNFPAALSGGEQVCVNYSGVPTMEGQYSITVSGILTVSLFGTPYNIGTFDVMGAMEILPNPNPISGCTYSTAVNFVVFANQDDGSCQFIGCMDEAAFNYNPLATLPDNTCIYECGEETCPTDVNEDGLVGTPDLLELLTTFGLSCQ